MKLKSGLLIVFSLSISMATFAQNGLLNAKTADAIFTKSEAQIAADNDVPLAYGYVDERDVLWGKNVWEIIDLSERKNFPLYFPIDTMNISSDRRSLYDVLLASVKNGRIPNIYADSYFNENKRTKRLSISKERYCCITS